MLVILSRAVREGEMDSHFCSVQISALGGLSFAVMVSEPI